MPAGRAGLKEGCPPVRDNTKAFTRAAADALRCPGPVVEFGAYQTRGQVGYADLRSLFPGATYVGTDLRDGPGVDQLHDVSNLAFPSGSFSANSDSVRPPYAIQRMRPPAQYWVNDCLFSPGWMGRLLCSMSAEGRHMLAPGGNSMMSFRVCSTSCPPRRGSKSPRAVMWHQLQGSLAASV